MTLLLLDRALLDAFRKGEAGALERVYRAYVGQVTDMLRNGFSFMSGPDVQRFRGYQDAWDLECAVQDTFIQAFSAAARQGYDGFKPFGPYLLAIARNRVISTLRSEQREQRRRSSLAVEAPAHLPDNPERQVLRREAEALGADFRGSLSREDLAFFDLRFRDEHNLMQTARALGLTRMKARLREEKLRRRFLSFLRRRGYLGQRPDGGGPGPGGAAGLLLLLLPGAGGR